MSEAPAPPTPMPPVPPIAPIAVSSTAALTGLAAELDALLAPPPDERRIDLSVIVVTFNSRELTLACVRSVLADCARTHWNVEVIVVDNASVDGTVEALQADMPSVRIIRCERNLGFAVGNNLGLRAAAGRYLFLLNSDTEVCPGALGTLVDFMEHYPEAGACGPQLLNPDGSLQPTGRDLPSLGSVLLDMTKLYRLQRRNLYEQRGRDYTRTTVVGELAAAALLVRREVYQHVGEMDSAFFVYYEDVDWCKRMDEAGYLIFYVPAAQVVHFWGGTSRNVSRLAYEAGQDSLRYYFRKHHGPIQSTTIKLMATGKETLLWLACAMKGGSRAEQRKFHAHMARRAMGPLPLKQRKRIQAREQKQKLAQQPDAQQPATVNPAALEPATPEPATPEPATPEPAPIPERP